MVAFLRPIMEYVKNIITRLGSQRSWHWTNWFIIGLILLFFVLAVAGIDSQSLWRDEALTLGRIQQPLDRLFANRNVVQGIDSPDLHPPLYFLILKFWSILVGTSEFSLRYLSLMAMVIALGLFAAVGRKIWIRETGVWAVALAAVSSFYLWYSQEARMYTMIVMLTLLFFYALWPLILGQSTTKQYILCGLVGALLIYTHYTGVFLVGFAAVALLVTRVGGQRLKWPVVILISMLIISLFLTGLVLLSIPLFGSVRELLTAQGFFAFEQRPIWDLLRETVNTFTLGSTIPVPDPGWRIAPFLLLAIVGIPALAVAIPRHRKQIILLGFGGFTITLFLFYLASFLQANYSNPRHLTVLSPILILLMAQGLTTLRRFSPLVAALIALTALVATSVSLWQTITSPPMIRDDVRSLAAYIEERARPGDAILWHDSIMMLTYDYYAGDIPYTAIPVFGQGNQQEAIKQLDAFAADFQRIWFVEKPSPSFFDASLLSSWFNDNMTAVERTLFPASWAALDLKLYRERQNIKSLPPDVLKVDISVGPYNIRGWEPEELPTADQGIWLTLYWTFNGNDDLDPLDLCLGLRDSADVVWTKACTELMVPRNTSAGESILSQQLWLPLPDGLAPAAYSLVLDRSNLEIKIGELSFDRFTTETNNAPKARFDNGVSLIDISWAAEDFQAGLWAIGYPLWQSNQQIDQAISARYRLVNLVGKSISNTDQPLGPTDYQAFQWQAGQTVRDFVGLALPFESNGWYRLQVGLLDEEGNDVPIDAFGPNRYWVNAGWIHVVEWPALQSLPDEIEPLEQEVLFGDHVRLHGYQVKLDDDQLVVDLYWQSDEILDNDLGVFVHIAQPGQVPVLQSSGAPAQWTRPTTTWRKDEIIHDRHTISLSPQFDFSDLEILTGFYDLQDSNSRLPVLINGEDSVNGYYRLSPVP